MKLDYYGHYVWQEFMAERWQVNSEYCIDKRALPIIKLSPIIACDITLTDFLGVDIEARQRLPLQPTILKIKTHKGSTVSENISNKAKQIVTIALIKNYMIAITCIEDTTYLIIITMHNIS